MADVITRFKLETTQYDSKLRDAAKGLKEVAHQAELGGKNFTGFNQKAIDAARALGTIESGANNVKDRLKDLVGAFNDAAKAYNNLSKEQQQSDFGKAMAQSLTQLNQRIKETKQELYGLGDAAKGGGLFSGDKFSGMLQVFGGNLMTKGAGMAMNFVSEMGDMVKQGIELAKAGEGVRLAFERLNQPGILANLREATHGTVTDLELMKAAVKFNDFKLPLEELGTMLAFAQQKAKDTGQSVDYMVDSIVTGLGRKSLMILDNLGLSAAEIRERMKETGDMTKAVGEIIREQMAKAGDYVETAADRATQANVSLQNKMEELGRKFGPLQEASTNFWTSMKIGILDVVGGPLTTLLNYLTQAQKTAEELVTGSMNQVGSNVDDKGNYIKRPAQKGTAGFDWEKGTWKPGYYGAIYNAATGQTELPEITATGHIPSTTPRGGGRTGKTFDASKIAFNPGEVGPNTYRDVPSVWAMMGDQGLRSMLGIGQKQFDYGKVTKEATGEDIYKDLLKQDKKLTDELKEGQEKITTLTSGLSAITSGLRQMGIELPKGLDEAISIIQGLSSVISGVQTVISVFSTSSMSANTAALIANTAALNANSFFQLFPFANGGIVKAFSGTLVGNTYSGDQLRGIDQSGQVYGLNAGEVVLNRAQVGNIASQLSGSDRPSGGQPYVDGETIYLGLSAYLKSTGRGEIMTSKYK